MFDINEADLRPVSNKPENWKTETSLRKRVMFSVSTTPEEFKNATIILDLRLKKIRLGKSHDYRDVINYEKRDSRTNKIYLLLSHAFPWKPV